VALSVSRSASSVPPDSGTGSGAVYLHEAIYWAGELIPQLRVDGLDEVAAKLAEISVMRVDDADDEPPANENN